MREKSKGRQKSSVAQPPQICDFTQQMRPQSIVDKKLNALIAFILFAFSLTIYWLTQNRSVTFWDVGEYIASSSILGVPHPPGNPFYILFARFCTILGFNTHHALIINSISGLMAALAVMFVYLFSVKLISMIEENKYVIYIGAIIAALYAAFSYTFWNNAIEASVYPGRDLVINLVIWLTLVWVEKTRDFSHLNLLLLIIYVFFLGFSIHQTTLQTLPAVLFIVIYPIILCNIKTKKFWSGFAIYAVVGLAIYWIFIQAGKSIHVPDTGKVVTGIFFCLITYFHLKEKIPLKVWLWGVVFIFIALSPHIYLFVRSELRPFINEGHPHNLELFSDYILRRQYGVVSFLIRRASLYYQLTHHFTRYFFDQFFHIDTIAGWTGLSINLVSILTKMIVILLGLLGMVYQAVKNKHSFVYFLVFFLMTSLAMVFVMNLSDAEVRDRDYFFSAFYLWGVWMAIGSIWLARYIAGDGRKVLVNILLTIFLLLPILNLASQYFIHDRSKEYIALDYGINFLNSLEENAIVFTNGDNDTFPLWYAQAVKDPMAKEYIHPAKEICPTPEMQEYISKAFEKKKKGINGVRPDVTVANLSLMNTPWYLRHLRDIEGVRFMVPDEKIDLFRPIRNNEDLKIVLPTPCLEDTLKLVIPERKVLMVKDTAVIQIVIDNFGIRPIYFAVTVPDDPIFEPFLRNEGMVGRIVPTRGETQMDVDRTLLNLEEVFEYRSIFDDSVNKDDNMKKLVTNYGAAFMRVSQYYHRQGDLLNSAKYLRKALQFIEHKERFYNGLTQLYIEAEEFELALGSIEEHIGYSPQAPEPYIQAVLIHLESKEVDKAFNTFERAVDNRVYDNDFISYIYLASQEFSRQEQGLDLMNRMKTYDVYSIVQDYIDALEHIKDNKLE